MKKSDELENLKSLGDALVSALKQVERLMEKHQRGPNADAELNVNLDVLELRMREWLRKAREEIMED